MTFWEQYLSMFLALATWAIMDAFIFESIVRNKELNGKWYPMWMNKLIKKIFRKNA